MLPAFKLGLGGKLGDGSFYWSWIAMDDLIRVVSHVLISPAMAGPVNAVSPHPVTNNEFTKTLGRILKRPTFFTVPEGFLKLAFGQMAEEALLCSFRVMPAQLIKTGFEFNSPALDSALRRLLLLEDNNVLARQDLERF